MCLFIMYEGVSKTSSKQRFSCLWIWNSLVLHTIDAYGWIGEMSTLIRLSSFLRSKLLCSPRRARFALAALAFVCSIITYTTKISPLSMKTPNNLTLYFHGCFSHKMLMSCFALLVFIFIRLSTKVLLFLAFFAILLPTHQPQSTFAASCSRLNAGKNRNN